MFFKIALALPRVSTAYFCEGVDRGGSGFAFTKSAHLMPCLFKRCHLVIHCALGPPPRGREPLLWPLLRNSGREAQPPPSQCLSTTGRSFALDVGEHLVDVLQVLGVQRRQLQLHAVDGTSADCQVSAVVVGRLCLFPLPLPLPQ